MIGCNIGLLKGLPKWGCFIRFASIDVYGWVSSAFSALFQNNECSMLRAPIAVLKDRRRVAGFHLLVHRG